MEFNMNKFLTIILIGITSQFLILTHSYADGAGSNPWDSAPKHLVEPIKLIDQQDYKTAITTLMSLSENHMDDADVYNLLGFSHRKSGEFDDALAFYTKALTIDPDHKGALEYLGELYVDTNQLELANMQLEKLSELCTFCKERRNLKKAIRKKSSS